MAAELPQRVVDLVGKDVLRITDVSSRWPALGELVVDGVAKPVALYLSVVGSSHRGRDDVERRFQNPGSNRPILEIPGRDLLLLGLWEEDPRLEVERTLLVSADPVHRLGLTTRYSIFVSVAMLLGASENGWSEGESSTGESIRCFLPELLPVSYGADAERASPEELAMQAAVASSGVLSPDPSDRAAGAARARQVGSRLVRDSRFSRRVVDAYDGLCAMCGLDVGLVEGAHIYPVSAPGSSDEPWNGMAMCGNHHIAFDKHILGVRAETSEIRFHEIIIEQASASDAVRSLVDGTFARLAEPRIGSARPRPEMFERRYEFYADHYRWLTAA